MTEPSQDLINKDTNTKQTFSAPTQNSFFLEQKAIEDSIQNLRNIPIKYYIIESYFLDDKSDLVKNMFITTLNKKISIYGSISSSTKKRNI